MRLIYAIQHNKTKRIYVGCTGRTGRIGDHFTSLKNGYHIVPLMQEDSDKYGFDFTAYVLEIANVDWWNSERKWMQYFGTGDERYGYNYRDPKAKSENVIDRRDELHRFQRYDDDSWFMCMRTGRYEIGRMVSSRNENEFRINAICQMIRMGYDWFSVHRRTRYGVDQLREMVYGDRPFTPKAVEAIAKVLKIDLI